MYQQHEKERNPSLVSSNIVCFATVVLEGTLWVKVLVMEDNGTPVSASCLDKARKVNVSLSRCVTSGHFHVHVGRIW